MIVLKIVIIKDGRLVSFLISDLVKEEQCDIMHDCYNGHSCNIM